MFGGGGYNRVGTAAGADDVVFGEVVNAPAVTGAGGISTPRLWGLFHLSTEATMIGERATRPDAMRNPSPPSPAWVGWNATVYFPSVSGFDITAGARNLIGKRDLIPTPGDYDRTDPAVLVVPRVPGEGREIYVKVGYAL